LLPPGVSVLIGGQTGGGGGIRRWRSFAILIARIGASHPCPIIVSAIDDRDGVHRVERAVPLQPSGCNLQIACPVQQIHNVITAAVAMGVAKRSRHFWVSRDCRHHCPCNCNGSSGTQDSYDADVDGWKTAGHTTETFVTLAAAVRCPKLTVQVWLGRRLPRTVTYRFH